MTSKQGPTAVNQLLDGLPGEQRARVLKSCKSVSHDFAEILCEPEQRLRHIYFPLTSVISLLAPVDGHRVIGVGMIGNEGILGATLALGIRDAPMRGIVQRSGTSLQIPVRQLQKLLTGSPALRHTLHRYLYVKIAQASKMVFCLGFHEVEVRLAFWLLMMHDRAHSDHFYFTHQSLADVLGVQRSAVTVSAGSFQQRGLISYHRGKISVVSRTGLEAASCECYKRTSHDYMRLFEQNRPQ